MDKPKRPWYVWVIAIGLVAAGIMLLLFMR